MVKTPFGHLRGRGWAEFLKDLTKFVLGLFLWERNTRSRPINFILS